MARPKPPKTVALGPLTIDVKFDKEAMAAASATGAYLADTGVVMLDPACSLGIEQDTVVHELLHAVWKQTYLRYDYPDEEADSVGEKMVATLAPRILELLRRNPRLVSYLVG